MTTPMYTDKEYLERRFGVLESMIEDTRGDISTLRDDIKVIEEGLTSNRIELAKSGGITAAMIAAVETVRQLLLRQV